MPTTEVTYKNSVASILSVLADVVDINNIPGLTPAVTGTPAITLLPRLNVPVVCTLLTRSIGLYGLYLATES